MPLVRCPDCCRDFEVSQDELASVIECAACEARFGPLVPRPAAAPPAPPPAKPRTDPDEIDGGFADPTAPDRRGRRIKPKSMTRFLPILLGILLGLGGTAAVAGSIYIALKYGQASAFPEPSVASPPALASPPSAVSKRPARPNAAR
jgi:hypothetical protein